MSQRGFVPYHRDFIGARTKGLLDCQSLILIIPFCPGSMGIDIVNAFQSQTSICQSAPHGQDRTDLRRLREMTAIGAGPVALDLSQDRDAALEGMAFGFQHENPRALAQHQSIPVGAERAASLRWAIVPGRKGAHG